MLAFKKTVEEVKKQKILSARASNSSSGKSSSGKSVRSTEISLSSQSSNYASDYDSLASFHKLKSFMASKKLMQVN